jgi:hypothetical protein
MADCEHNRDPEGCPYCHDEQTIARLKKENADLLKALEDLFKQCTMVHRYWGECDNTKEADAAIKQGLALIDKAKGE